MALAVASAAAIGRAVVECAAGLDEELALYVACVLPSGERKSAVVRAAVAPLRQVESEAVTAARPTVAEARAQRETLEERRRLLVRDVARDMADPRELDHVSAPLAAAAS